MTSTRMTLLLCTQNIYWVVLNFTNVEPATGTMGRCVPDVLWGGAPSHNSDRSSVS